MFVIVALWHFVFPFRLLLWDRDDRYYGYFIEVSTDRQNWRRVVDKTAEQCRYVGSAAINRSIHQWAESPLFLFLIKLGLGRNFMWTVDYLRFRAQLYLNHCLLIPNIEGHPVFGILHLCFKDNPSKVKS